MTFAGKRDPLTSDKVIQILNSTIDHLPLPKGNLAYPPGSKLQPRTPTRLLLHLFPSASGLTEH